MQNHLFPEWGQGESGHLEMLLGKRNTDDRDKEQDSEEDVHETRPQTAEDDPEDIQRDTNATDGAIRILHLSPERP